MKTIIILMSVLLIGCNQVSRYTIVDKVYVSIKEVGYTIYMPPCICYYRTDGDHSNFEDSCNRYRVGDTLIHQ